MSNKKILMVCLGNICRSPVAEGILKKKINENNLPVQVDSCGTSNYHIGSMADKRSRENARANGIDISDHRARQFSANDFKAHDFIFVMDKSNYQNVIKMASSESETKKVSLILNLINENSNKEVPDPYYEGEEGFQIVFNLLDAACDKIIERLL
jgi:protein-tyrosine phosphatase